MIQQSFMVEGHVSLKVMDAAGNVRRSHDFKNAVLDAGVADLIGYIHDNLADSSLEDLTNYLFLGTGTTQPSVNDGGLESRSGSLAGKYRNSWIPVSTNVDTLSNACRDEWKLEFRYGEGEAEGVWTELGLADQNYSYPLTRSLIKDDQGNPVSLTVLNDEFLSVDYWIVVYTHVHGEGSFTADGVTYNWKAFVNPHRNILQEGYGSTDEPTMDMAVRYRYCYASPSSLNDYPTIEEFASYESSSIPFSSEGNYVQAQTRDFSNVDATSSQIGLIVDPTEADVSIEALVTTPSRPNNGWTANNRRINAVSLMCILFDKPVVKPADHRITFDLQISSMVEYHPVQGLGHSATTTSLDFTWDAYPDATEYQLILRQAGAEIDTQTITDPTVTASFTGLSASTEHHLEIKAVTPSRESAPLIYAASTTA